MTMEVLMVGRLHFSICFVIEILLTWSRAADATAIEVVQDDTYNMTCIEGCTCSDSSSENHPESLLTLDCSFNNMKMLPGELPKDLQVLSLRGNSVLEIPENIAHLDELREIDLSGNKIESIGSGKLFQNMSRLSYLNIGKNSITSLFQDSFIGPKSLKQLILSENKISHIENEALIDLEHLQSLDLRQNLLTILQREWFNGLEMLVILNLAHNNIQNIPASAFRPLKSLERLYLTGNRISSVDPRAFSGLLNLQLLAMDDNLLSRIPTAAFQSLPVLQTLKVDQNPLTKIKPLDFSHLSVTKISLNHMQELRIIDAKAFYNLINISSIYITYNMKLSYIDPLAFMNIEPLRELHLNKNNLQGIQKEMQEYLPKSLQLSIHDNPLRCDCNVRWLRKIVNQNETSNMRLDKPEHIVCHTPERLREKLLKDIDLFKMQKVCTPVVLNLSQSQLIDGKIGERQVLECRALGSPIPQLHWILPDGSIVNSTLNEIKRRFFPPGTLVYYHLEMTDSGTYTCVAQNSVGYDSSTFNVTATGIDISIYPSRISSSFVNLKWNGTDWDDSHCYKVLYNKVESNSTKTKTQVSVVSAPTNKFTINHLDPDTDYQFCLGYEDDTGYWLEISCCFARTPIPEISGKRIYQISILAFIGMLGIVITLTLLVMCLISTLVKNYRHRLYETPDKSTDSFSIPLVSLYQPLLKGS